MNLNFSLTQTTQFNTIINLFCLVPLTLKLLFPVSFLQFPQCTSIVYISKKIGQYFFNNIFLAISFLQSGLLDDCFMCINTSVIALKMSKSFLPELVLIKSQLSFCSIVFCLFILQSIFLSLCSFSCIFFLRVYSHGNIN